ncbi:MAG: pyridoxamine 5'-phosphate oxidase family protein, partial [Methanoregula sp.]|nr:pyridoxamine 5'-phosphate oxidase family protein [Methanoregula sp.]
YHGEMMRRKDREILDPAEMAAILTEATVCRIAMTDGDEPYVVPLCFGFMNDTIWIHSAHEGKKIALLTKNPHCCVEVDACDGPLPDEKPCRWECRYKSVICTGDAEPVEDYDEKRKGLACILHHYGGGEYTFTDPELDRVCVMKIVIKGMTGKKYGY